MVFLPADILVFPAPRSEANYVMTSIEQPTPFANMTLSLWIKPKGIGLVDRCFFSYSSDDGTKNSDNRILLCLTGENKLEIWLMSELDLPAGMF